MKNNSSISNASRGDTQGNPSSMDLGIFLPLAVSWSVMGVVSTILNVLVCLVVLRNKPLWTTTNAFIVSLSIADLLSAAVLIPLFIFEWVAVPTYAISGYLIAFILLASIANLGAVTYERYVALTRPLYYRSIMSKRKVTVIIALSWAVPFTIALLPLAWQADTTARAHQIYLLVTIFACVLLPCLSMVVIYVRLLRVVRRFIRRNRRRSSSGNRTGERAGREEKAARVFALIFASFLLCWLPLIYINVCDAFRMHALISPPVLFMSFYTLLLNTVLDPFIYAFFKKDINQFLRRQISCCGKKNNSSKDPKSGNTTFCETKGESVL